MNITYVTVDSLRKDAVNREIMPYLTDLRSEGIWFEEMMATAPATAASFVGLMASRYYSDVDGIGLPVDAFTTVAEALQPDYRTVGISTNQFTSAYYNYDRGFDWFESPSKGIKFTIRRHLDEEGPLFNFLEWSYHRYLMLRSTGRTTSPKYFNTPASEVNKKVLKQLSGEPWFAWLHHMDIHHPLEPPEEYLPSDVSSRSEAQELSRDIVGQIPEGRKDDLERVRSLYHAECQYWDDEFRDFHAHLPEDTLLVIVGDHGELLGEHDRFGHPHEMWRELINVPCIIHHPELPSKTITTQQSTIDLAPTIVDLAGEQVPDNMRGSVINIESPSERTHAYGTIETPDNVGFVRNPEFKWVRHQSRRSTQNNQGELLFHSDGPEQVTKGRQLIQEYSSEADELRELFDDKMSETVARGHTLEDEQVTQHLADLGYLQQE